MFDEKTKQEFRATFDVISSYTQDFLLEVLQDERKMVFDYLRSLKDTKDTDFLVIKNHLETEKRKLLKRLEEKDMSTYQPSEILSHLEVML